MLELPQDATNPLELADWLELYALVSADQNASRSDIERGLRRAALVEIDDDDAIERTTLDTFEELEQRFQASGEAYPFDLSNQGVVKLKSNLEEFPVYIFCLCLSYLGSDARDSLLNPRKLFEDVSCWAAKGYLQGKTVGFGSPRADLSSSFGEAVTELCGRIGEGKGHREHRRLRPQDDALDLIAWKDFSDGRPSKLIMFGQCASGRNWENKLGELNPRAFCGEWMQDSLISPEPIRSFFIPHRVDRDRWEFNARKAGIFFDRCRIAFWASQANGADYRSHIAWVKAAIGKAK